MRHTRLFVFSILLALLAAMPASAQGEFEWVLAREYTSLEFHDPGLLMLRDAGGTESGLEFGYEGLTYEVVETSPQGKKIRVACTPERGSEVIDPESDERYPIRSAPPPIDELQSRCLEREESTIGMSACHAGADAAWDLELNRAYQDVMESDLSDETKLAIRTAQRRWIEFRDASMTAARTVGKEKGGSVRTLEVAGMAVALTRDQTLKLRGYLD